ncbi:hypothetical protein BDZ89DRAFT_1058819 [Hymenopellis radicata]|nr:hypothetical protein BDZ89DRAFT_1058819 [Hymenopellis radicata]
MEYHQWDGPEYRKRCQTPFSPPTVTLKQIHQAVPKHLLKPNAFIASAYVLRDVLLALFFFRFAMSIDTWDNANFGGHVTSALVKRLFKTALWLVYWWFQGLVGAGLFCLGHDAGHGTLFNSKAANNLVGFILHTGLMVPYFAWRATHHAHHKATSSMERDENYVPYLRSDYKLPSADRAKRIDYDEVFEETPLYTLLRILIMQGTGWWLYLSHNVMGSRIYPPGTNHFDPNSPLFRQTDRNNIILSNIGLLGMSAVLFYMGPSMVLRYYLVPYLLTNHWIVMFTFLHHSDPTIPHYRKDQWSFLRGAAATVDRPLLGYLGRFFLHNISHDHVARTTYIIPPYHFFSQAPFYNGPLITRIVKDMLGESYNYDSTPSFYALYRSFTRCLFVENDADIVFYKDRYGKAARVVQQDEVERIRESGWNAAKQDNL